MNRPSRRGPYAGTPGKRAEILRAALESFAAHGYERASLRDIAGRAGMTHVGLLHHFAGKKELLEAALDQREEEERDFAAKSAAEGLEGADLLTALLEHNLEQSALARAWSALRVAASEPDHPAHAFFTRRQARLHAELTATYTAAGTSIEPEVAATLLLSLLTDLQVQQLFDPDLDVTTPLQRLLEFLLPDDI